MSQGQNREWTPELKEKLGEFLEMMESYGIKTVNSEQGEHSTSEIIQQAKSAETLAQKDSSAQASE